MRDSTSTDTERAKQAQPLRLLEGVPSPEYVARQELGLITRDAAASTGALTGLLVVWNAAEEQLDVICACGTAPSKDRLPLPTGRSGFVGRVLESGCRVGEPITVAQGPQLGPALSGQVKYAVGAALRPPGGPPGALCVGLPAKPRDHATALWVVESYARLVFLGLHG